MTAVAAPSAVDFTVEVDTLAAADWDRMTAGFADASCDQTACWVDRRWGTRRSSHLVLRRHGTPVAAARVVILEWPGLRRGVAYVKFGPMWRPRGMEPDLAVHRRCMDALVEEYCGRRGHCLSVLPRMTPGYYQEECEALGGLGFTVRRAMPDPNRYLVDVTLDPAEQMPSLDQKWRYNLRQALRNGIECRLGDTEEGLATFTALHARMVSRKQFSDTAAVHLLPALASGLPETLRPRIVLAFHGQKPVAGAIVALAGDTAFYLFGASDDAALGLRAGYALQWWIVAWLSQSTVRWYDLGGEAFEPGLRQFKKGLSGKRGAIVSARGELDRWTSRGGRLAADAIYGLRRLQRAFRSAS